MFLPSGLAYYSNATSNIGAYSPLIFTFKLCEVHYRDHDGDGILSKDERKLDPSINKLIRWKENPAGNTYKFDSNGNLVIDVPHSRTACQSAPAPFGHSPRCTPGH